MENPVVNPFLRNIPNPPPHPPLDWMIQVIQSYTPFQNFVADENKDFGIEIPDN